MQHTQEIPINIKTCINTQHENEHTIDTYLLEHFTNYVETFQDPPSFRPRCSSLWIVGHPWAGTKLHPSKGIPRLSRDKSGKKKNLVLGSYSTNSLQRLIPGAYSTNNLQPPIPHMHVPLQEVFPFSTQQSFDCPTSLPELQQQAVQEFQITIVAVGIPQ